MNEPKTTCEHLCGRCGAFVDVIATRNSVIDEIEAALPEQATERNSAKVSTKHCLSYDQVITWNEYGNQIRSILTNLRKQ